MPRLQPLTKLFSQQPGGDIPDSQPEMKTVLLNVTDLLRTRLYDKQIQDMIIQMEEQSLS
jgi:hypothetical protein